jgi:hypothetical protein
MVWKDPQHDPLDELLRTAAWPEPNAEQIDRLQTKWQTIVHRRKSTALVLSLAMAALVLVAVSIGSSFMAHSIDRSGRPMAEQIAFPPKVDSPKIIPPPTVHSSEVRANAPSTASRDPDAFELALAIAYGYAKASPPTNVQELAQPTPPQDTVVTTSEVVSTIDNVPTIESAKLEEKFSAMYSPRVAARLLAAVDLGSLNNPWVSKRLVQMVFEGQVRRESLIALLHSSDPVARDFLARAQNDLTLAPSLRALHADSIY